MKDKKQTDLFTASVKKKVLPKRRRRKRNTFEKPCWVCGKLMVGWKHEIYCSTLCASRAQAKRQFEAGKKAEQERILALWKDCSEWCPELYDCKGGECPYKERFKKLEKLITEDKDV